MKTVEITLYNFNELSSEAQQNAINKWRESETEYFWGRENQASLEAFTAIFPIRVENFSYDAYSHDETTQYAGESDYQTMSGSRLVAHLMNNYYDTLFRPKTYYLLKPNQTTKTRKSRITVVADCNLTGYYMDEVLLAPIYEFLKTGKGYDFEDLLSECVYQWGKACEADCSYQQSDTCIRETIECNDYDFTAEGELY